jgi:hypothetical protein
MCSCRMLSEVVFSSSPYLRAEVKDAFGFFIEFDDRAILQSFLKGVVDHGASLVMLDPDGWLWPGSVAGPFNMPGNHVLGALQPLKADHGSGAAFWFAEIHTAMGESVDLFTGIREQAKRNRAAVPQRHGIASALHRELSAMFDPANCVQFKRTEESTVPIDNDLLYGTRAIAQFLEIPLTKCRDLISLGNLPTFQMPGSTTRCARKSSLNAHWQAFEQAAAPVSRAA